MKAGSKSRGRRGSIAAGDASGAEFGQNLRRMRRRSNLTLRAVAERAGCSESLISKIETGKALPSLSTLHRIVAAIGGNILTLFTAANARPSWVWKAAGRPVISMGDERRKDSVVLEQLVSGAPDRMLEANVHVVRPGTGSDGAMRHDGEEKGYVLSGAIELTIDGRKHILSEGDSFAFRSKLSHSYRNAGRKTARTIWINTPPTF